MSTQEPNSNQDPGDATDKPSLQARQQAETDLANQNLVDALSETDALDTQWRSGHWPLTATYTIAASLFLLLILILFYAWRKGSDAARSEPSISAYSAKKTFAEIDVEYILKVENLDYSLKYSAEAVLANAVVAPLGKNRMGVTEHPVLINELRGAGEGDYTERSVSTAPSDYCTITRMGKVTMQVTVHPDINAVDAKIIGPVERKVFGKAECDANVKKGNVTDVTCGFENVDFARGGIYHGSADEPRSGEGVEVYQRTCTLHLTPMVVTQQTIDQ